MHGRFRSFSETRRDEIIHPGPYGVRMREKEEQWPLDGDGGETEMAQPGRSWLERNENNGIYW